MLVVAGLETSPPGSGAGDLLVPARLARVARALAAVADAGSLLVVPARVARTAFPGHPVVPALHRALHAARPDRDTVSVAVAPGRPPGAGPSGPVPLDALLALLRAHAVVLYAEVSEDPAVLPGEAPLLTAALARDLGADVLLLLDGTAAPGAPRAATPAQLRADPGAGAALRARAEAACRFVEETGGTAVLGDAGRADALLHRRAGTVVALPEVPASHGGLVATRCGVPLHPRAVPDPARRPEVLIPRQSRGARHGMPA